MKKLLAASIIAASTLTFAGGAMADDIVSYSLSGATFNSFNNPGGATETVSGTWTVDYTTMTITALSLTATGTETINFDLAGVYELTYTGGGGNTQYELGVSSTETGSLFFLDYQTNSPLSLLVYSYNDDSTHLHLLDSGYYSGLNGPGQLDEEVPEPGTLALFGMALLALGGLGLRRKFV